MYDDRLDFKDSHVQFMTHLVVDLGVFGLQRCRQQDRSHRGDLGRSG